MKTFFIVESASKTNDSIEDVKGKEEFLVNLRDEMRK